MRYTQAYDNQWLYPKRKFWMMKCCDCGLVHKVEFKLKKYGNGRIIMLKAKRLPKRKKVL